MKKSYYLLFLLVFFLTNCKKDNSLEDKIAKGRVVDLVTGEPVVGAYVALFESAGNILQPGLKLSAETFTDTDGYFNFGSAKGDEVKATKANYYDSRYYTTIGNEYIHNPVVTLEPYAYINLHCKNVSKIYGGIGFYLLIKGKTVRFGGLDVDTIIRGSKIHSANTKLEYVLTRWWDGKAIDSLHNILITPRRFDTIDVYVNY